MTSEIFNILSFSDPSSISQSKSRNLSAQVSHFGSPLPSQCGFCGRHLWMVPSLSGVPRDGVVVDEAPGADHAPHVRDQQLLGVLDQVPHVIRSRIGVVWVGD